MNTKRRFGHALVCVTILSISLLTSCAGHSSSASIVPTSGGAMPSQSAAPVHSGTPTASVAVTLSLGLSPSAKAVRRLKYVSTATQSMTIAVSNSGNAATTATVNCTMTCSASLAAPVGSDTLSVTLFDEPAGAGRVLSLNLTSITVKPQMVNTFSLTVNPVIDHVNPVLTTTSSDGGVAVDSTLSINAFDADNQRIIGPGHYVDESGNPLTISPSVAITGNGGPGTLALPAGTVFTSPTDPAITAHYDGGWMASAVISLTSSLPIHGALSTIMFSTVPHVTEMSSGFSSSIKNGSIIVGSDGNVWVGESNGMIAKILPDGAITEYGGLTSPADILSMGYDHQIWFTEPGADRVGHMTVNGALQEFSVGIPVGAAPSGICEGPNNLMWFVEDGRRRVATISMTGSVSEFPTVFTGLAARDAVRGPDGDMWFSIQGPPQSSIATMTSVGVLSEYTDIEGNPLQLLNAPDGTIRAGDFNNQVDTVTAAGVGTATGMSGNPIGVVYGVDGNYWVTQQFGNMLARLTPSGIETDYSDGLSVGANPYFIVAAPNGALWFVEDGTGYLAKFVY